MEVGKQYLPLLDQFVLGFDGLLHLDDHLCDGIRLLDSGQHLSTYGDVFLVAETAVNACCGLYIHCMTSLHQFGYAGRGHAYAVLIVLNFFRYSNNHSMIYLVV